MGEPLFQHVKSWGVPLHAAWYCCYIRDIRQVALSLPPTPPSLSLSLLQCMLRSACLSKCKNVLLVTSHERGKYSCWRITLPQSTYHLEKGSPATDLVQQVRRVSRAVQKYESPLWDCSISATFEYLPAWNAPLLSCLPCHFLSREQISSILAPYARVHRIISPLSKPSSVCTANMYETGKVICGLHLL